MALILADRVKEVSTTTGTGDITLGGASPGFQTFASAIGAGNTCYYCIAHANLDEWEVGIGTVGTGVLVRTTVLDSSTGGALVAFSVGEKSVFVTYPASKVLSTDMRYVAPPTNITPTAGDIGVVFKPALVGSIYAPLYSVDTLSLRQFQVTLSTDTSFATPIVDTSVASESYTVTQPLPPDTSYIWRCRDISDSGFTTDWSTPTGFTTKAGEVIKPTVTSPTAGRTDVENEIFTSSTFAITGGSDTLSGSEWELYSGDVLVHSSGLVSDSTKYSFPIGVLVVLTDYEVRVRHIGVNYGASEWSDFVAFTTGSVLGYGNYMAVAHYANPHIYVYGRDIDNNQVLPNPATLPPNAAGSVAFSADGTYMAVTHGVSPYVTIYKRSGDTFTKLPNPATLPTGAANNVAFSANGTYMAVSHKTSPFITIYKRSGDTFTKLPNPAALPSSTAYGVAFSADSTYMAVGHEILPLLTVYKRDGDTFTRLPGIATPSSHGNGVAFSADGTYMAVAQYSNPYIAIYKRSGDTFTKLPDPAALPTNEGRGVAFSANGTYMAVAHGGSPFITIYKRSGDTFTKLPNPASIPQFIAYGVAFSADSTYMAVVHTGSPYVTIYKRSGDTFTKLPNPATLPTNTAYGVAFWPSALYGA